MFLEIQNIKIQGDRLIFKVEYDEEFRESVGLAINKPLPSRKDIQNFILNTIETSVDLDSLTEL